MPSVRNGKSALPERVTDLHYSDPDLVPLYDQINAGGADFDHYLTYLPKYPCRILDLGCGTGRFTRELAELGHHVTGIDPAPEMLNLARNNAVGCDIAWQLGIAQDLSANAQFDHVFMTGHAFQCLLTDTEILATFNSVCAHLAPKGQFHFETRNPGSKPWQGWCDAPAHVTTETGGSLTIDTEILGWAGEVLTFRLTYRSEGWHKTSTSALRFAPKETLIDLAGQANLQMKTCFGDWSRGPFHRETSPEIILSLCPA